MTDQEWYDYGQAHCGIEVGDSVKVLRTALKGEMGWTLPWHIGMNKYIGETVAVGQVIGRSGFQCSTDGFWFPFFVLELVKKAKPEPTLPQSILDIIDNEGCFSWTLKEPIKKLVTEILKQK